MRSSTFVAIPSDLYSPRVMLIGRVKYREEKQNQVPYTKYYACTFRISKTVDAHGIKTYAPIIPTFTSLKPTSEKHYLWDASTGSACYLPFGDRYFHFTPSMTEALAKDERRAKALFVIYTTIFAVITYYASELILASVNSWFLNLGASFIIRQVSVVSAGLTLTDLERTMLSRLYAYDQRKKPFDETSPKLTVAYLVSEFAKHRHRWWSPSYEADLSEETSLNRLNGKVPKQEMPEGANMVTFVMKLKQLLRFDNLRMSRREVAPGYWVYSYDNPFYK